MGGKGSGPTIQSKRAERIGRNASKLETAATTRFYTELHRQAGDSLFEVWRCYPSGKKACVGNTEDIRTDQLAVQFGGGDYELVQLDRSKMIPTGKPPLRKVLHPGKYPIRPEFEIDPVEMELQAGRERAMQSFGGGAGGADLAALSPEQIFEKAKEEIRREMVAEKKLDDLQSAITNLTNQVNNLATNGAGGGGQGGGNVAMLRELLALSKDLTPVPTAANAFMPTNPADVIRGAVDAIKTFQTEMATLPGGSPFERALKEAPAGNPNVGALSQALTQIATAALPYLLGRLTAPAEAAPAGAPLNAPGAAPLKAPAGVAVAAAQAAPTEPELQTMLAELGAKLAADQTEQLSVPPAGHITNTVQWVAGRWDDPASGPAWANLKMAVRSYPEPAVLDFVGKQLPQLYDTEPKKNWVAGLVDLLRKA